MIEYLNEWEQITNNIFQAVKASGKSQKEIALELGVSESTISQFISGKAFPSLITLKHLCKILDCSYEEILGE